MIAKQDNRFHFLTGDVNFREYGGTWYRVDSDTEFTIIEMVNMEDACNDISKGKYMAIISEVDITDPVKNASALDCCGYTLIEAMNNKELLVIAHVGHGPNHLASMMGNNFYKLLRDAKNY